MMIDLTTNKLKDMLKQMLLIRHAKLAADAFYANGSSAVKVPAPYGEELVSVIACAALNGKDYLASGLIQLPYAIARGADIGKILAEIRGEEDGLCGGKSQGKLLAYYEGGNFGVVPASCAGVPVGVGAALSIDRRNSDQVALSVFDATETMEGIFHESLNMAGLWKLPVVLLCVNRGISGELFSVQNVADMGMGYSIPSVVVDGCDAVAVYDAISSAVGLARNHLGPTLIEVKLPKLQEKDLFSEKDPVEKFAKMLMEEKLLSRDEYINEVAEAKATVIAACASAQASVV